ncbi:MAG: replicative DNA helicase [Litorilinea sp.]|nr:MAG: replicative DNA helicase [Litorilinea sp.]
MDGQLQNGTTGSSEPSTTRTIPANLEAERAVLGALLIDPDAIIKVANFLRPEDFFRERHAWLYEAMLALNERHEPLDFVTLVDELERRGQLEDVGGPAYITDLISTTPTAIYVDHYARIVERTAVLRRLIAAAGKIAELAYDESQDVDEVVDRAEQIIFGVSESRIHRDLTPIRAIMTGVVERIDFLTRNRDTLMGVPTGFTMLDRLLGGFQKSDLIILAGRPGMGKTSFALSIAQNAAKRYGARVAIFSLEMSSEQLVQRLLSMETGIDSHRLRLGDVHEEEWPILLEAANMLASTNIFIDDTPAASVTEIRTKARRLYAEHGLDLILIDYMQLMTGQGGRNENRQQEISYISRSLKALARELNVPVIALSQLSRAVESRADKRPMLSDLRECVAGDTLVCLADGRRVPIAELVGTAPEVWAIGEDQRLVRARSECVWKVGRRPVFRLVLASGRELRATAEHRVLTGRGWLPLSSLAIGDRVALARRLPSPDQPTEWPETHLILLAHLIGDGSYLNHQPLRYTTASEENSEIVSYAARQGFGVTVNRHPGRGNWHQLVFSGNGDRWHPRGINRWLRELSIFGQRSHEKCIPAPIFSLPDHQVALFLRHLWATDGSIYVPTRSRQAPRVYFSTCSRTLAHDIAALLLRFAIVARVRSSKQRSGKSVYTVDIYGAEQQLRFLKTVGAFGPRTTPAQILGEVLQTVQPNTNVDTLPQEIFDRIKDVMRVKKISHRRMADLRGTSYGGSSHFQFAPSRKMVADYAELLDDPILQQWAESDLFWDRVVNLIPDGEEDVYDLTVPGPACWLADGIVSHNSGSIEQDADVVLFIYREDYYIEDTDRQNIADVLVAKHRHGSTGTASLYFRKELTQFRDLEIQRTDLEY